MHQGHHSATRNHMLTFSTDFHMHMHTCHTCRWLSDQVSKKFSVMRNQVCDASRTSVCHTKQTAHILDGLPHAHAHMSHMPLAVRSGLQKFSVMRNQVCDASRTSFCHTTPSAQILDGLPHAHAHMSHMPLAVRSGLQKFSVMKNQVCDASRTSLCHAKPSSLTCS